MQNVARSVPSQTGLPEPHVMDEPVESSARAAAVGASHAARWPLITALVLSTVFWLLTWYGETVVSIVSIWVRSETFTHGFLIAPIVAWMIWRRRGALAVLEPRPNFWVLPLLILTGFVWLLGTFASAGVVQQFAMVAMVPLIVWTVLGRQVVRALSFPLFFLFFAVPFGEFLVPTLMRYTADFTVLALRLTGIPVYREGQFFALPTGNWSVVEACGGLRYLIASVTLGFLYAYLMYRSMLRRALFVAVSFVVPLIANWARAYMIVMIGHLSDMQYAVGIDHLIYGWVFFGVVMLILLWIGSFWREDMEEPTRPPVSNRTLVGSGPMSSVAIAAILSGSVVAVWPVMSAHLIYTGSAGMPVLQLPEDADGWQPVSQRITNWTPHFSNPTLRLNQTYAREATRVGLYVGYYYRQRTGAELITSLNALVHSSGEWRSISESDLTVSIDGQQIEMTESRLRGPSADILVWYSYWIDGHYTTSQYWAKLLQAKSLLFGRGDDSAVIIVFTQANDVEAGRMALRSFVNSTLVGVSQALAHAR
jgi:exosortase A